MLDGANDSIATDEVGHTALIGDIYDCAIAPERWEKTLKTICESGHFQCATINLFDRRNKQTLIQQCVGLKTGWMERYWAHAEQYGAEIHHIRNTYFEKLQIDAPMVLSRHVPREAYSNTRYYQEWMRPQQLIDVMQLLMLRQPDRYGAIHFGRHEQRGPIGDRDMALGALLLPHLQRALTISNLLEVQSLRASNLRSTIGNLSTGIALLAQDGTILEANPAAERLIERCPVACIVDGRLTSHDPQQAAMLRQALRAAARGEPSSMSDARARNSASGGVLSSYILPLGGGDIRPNIRETAVGAMLITPDEHERAQMPKAEILSAVFGLTAAEARVAEALADGKTSLHAAKSLGISEATIRTHLTRIFMKTGVTRQAELILLMHRLAVPF